MFVYSEESSILYLLFKNKKLMGFMLMRLFQYIRMLKYASLIYEHYGEFPKQMVLYICAKKLKIKDQIITQNLCYTY